MSSNAGYDRSSRSDGLLGGYIFSRPLLSLVLGIPSLLLLGLIAAGYGWVGTDVRLVSIPIYESQLIKARTAGDRPGQLIALNTLVQMRPDTNEYRYDLAVLRLEDENPANGVAMMRDLSERGFNPARLWVARQSFVVGAKIEDCRKAVDILRAVVEDDPKNATAHAMLADAYLMLKQPELAAPHTRMATKLDPIYWLKYSRLLSTMGHSAEAKKAAKQASIALQNLVAKDPTDTQRRIQWSHALRTQGRLKESLTALERGLRLDAENEELKQEMCLVFASTATSEQAGGIVDYRRFSGLLQQALKFDPSNVKVIGQLAEVPNSEHTVDDALLADIRKVLSQKSAESPDNAKISGLLAWCEFQLDDQDAAFERLKASAESHPGLGLQLATLYRDIGQETEARKEAIKVGKHFQAMSKKEPENSQHQLNMATAFSFLKKWDPALAVLDRIDTDVLDEDQAKRVQSARVRYRLKMCYALQKGEKKDPQRQLELMQQVLQIDSGNRLAIAGIGIIARDKSAVGKRARQKMQAMLSTGQNAFQVHSHLGTNAIIANDYELAVKHLEQAHRISSIDPLVCNNLAFAICQAPSTDKIDYDRSLALSEQALGRLPNNPEILKTRGVVYLKLERFEDALHDFESVLKRNNDDPEVHKYLAETYTALKNDELAELHLKLSRKSRKSAGDL